MTAKIPREAVIMGGLKELGSPRKCSRMRQRCPISHHPIFLDPAHTASLGMWAPGTSILSLGATLRNVPCAEAHLGDQMGVTGAMQAGAQGKRTPPPHLRVRHLLSSCPHLTPHSGGCSLKRAPQRTWPEIPSAVCGFLNCPCDPGQVGAAAHLPSLGLQDWGNIGVHSASSVEAAHTASICLQLCPSPSLT